MTEDVLILFMRQATLGRVKSRIAVALGEQLTLGLYEAFIRDVLSMAATVKADKLIAVAGMEDRNAGPDDFGTEYPVIKQQGTDIGRRMCNAFLWTFESGHDRAVLIGSDAPDLQGGIIEDALDVLRTREAVIGPSTDGGYYLIGFRKETVSPDFFRGIDWGTAAVFRQTLDRMESRGLSLSVCPPWQDIDTVNDVRSFFKRNKGVQERCPHTMRYLMDCISLGTIDL